MLDPDANAAALLEILKSNQTDIISAPDKIQQFKAVKNPVELAGIRRAHLRDGVAVTKFLCWLDANRQGKTELDIVENCTLSAPKATTIFPKALPPLPLPARTAPLSTIIRTVTATVALMIILCCCLTAALNMRTAPPTSPALLPWAFLPGKWPKTLRWF